MIDITVVRGAADIVGETISDPLIETTPVAVQRGRNAIDGDSKIKPVTLRTLHRPNLKTGVLIEVLDALQGRVWRGKVRTVDIAVEGLAVTATLGVEQV